MVPVAVHSDGMPAFHCEVMASCISTFTLVFRSIYIEAESILQDVVCNTYPAPL